MVRHVKRGGAPAWKALAAIGVVAGGLVWHLVACTESPMAFSPDGRQLAFVTMEPYDDDLLGVAGTHVFRLMVLTDRTELRVVEETADWMLSGPAWTGDGKRVAYLRIPMAAPGLVKRLEEAKAKAKAGQEAAEGGAGGAAEGACGCVGEAEKALYEALAPSGEGAPAPVGEGDYLGAPALPALAKPLQEIMDWPPLPAVLVLRDAATWEVAETRRVDLVLGGYEGGSLMMLYAKLGVVFGSEPEWLYVCDGYLLQALDPTEDKRHVLAAPATGVSVSPDGKKVASLLGELTDDGEGDCVMIARPGERAASYRSFAGEDVILDGVKWVGDERLAVLVDDGKAAAIHLLRPDASVERVMALELPPHGTDRGKAGTLAVAPDGRHMVVAYDKNVYFLDAKGVLLKHWESESEVLARPTFTPDSRHVAMKHMPKGGHGDSDRVGAIVFYTPAGEEVCRAEVPPAELEPMSAEALEAMVEEAAAAEAGEGAAETAERVEGPSEEE